MISFFNYISHKNKTLYFISTLLTSSIVCPLTSCGSDGTSNDIGGFDQEFGFDAQTYNNLERQFISKYGASLKDKFPDSNEFENKLNNFLKNDLAILRNKLFDPAQNYSFTFRTNTLLDYASKNFNIYLNRNANIGDIDFDNLKQSSLENFVIYMENMEFSKAEIDKKQAEFNNEFDNILKKCKSKTLDNAQILMQLRADVIDCWKNLDDEFAYLSAYNHLKNFFNEYEFKVKDQSENLKDNNELLWDKLLKTSAFIGENNIGKINQDINHPIADDWIRNLITISRKVEKSEKKEDDKDTPANDNSSAETNYSKEIIPGFILTPVLKTMSENIYSNDYYMNIDWQLMYAKYQDKDQKTKNKVTAHLATTKDGKAVDYADFKDGQLPSDSYQFTRYSFMATPSYQKQKMIEAYFDQTKEPDQKIVFSWNKYMFGIEYFLPSNAKSADFEVPKESYKLPMARNNLSLIGLQLNGINLLDLLNKKTNLQDSQSAINVNNDDNLGIEEKFVKYCDVNTIANVTFFDNDISKNTIQNDFVAGFTNSDIQHNVEMKSNMNNIWPSKSFFNNAVNFYKQVANYVDTGKILDNAESNHWLTNAINVELYILSGIVVFILICTIIRYKFCFRNGKLVRPDRASEQDIVKDMIHSMIRIIFIGVTTLILIFVWEFAVRDPIKVEVDEIKKWNDTINEKSQSSSDKKINVIDKVNGEDKKNFESIDNFTSYYEKKSNTAFESYFYYFHFVELSQKQKNNEHATTLDEKVKKDYDDFNDTKNGFEIDDRDVARIIIGIIPIFIIIYGLFLVVINVLVTCLVISDYFAYDANNVGQNINNNLNNAQRQIHRLPVINEGDNNNIVI